MSVFSDHLSNMLVRLHISNFALIEDVAIDLSHGLSCFTGETGAGKSILIDGICRLMGARTSTEDIRAGATRAVLEAVFDATSLTRTVAGKIEEWGIEWEEELILRRDILASGKSRSLINNCSVTVQQLKQIGSSLINVFGQNEHQTLLDPDSQRDLYDSAIGIEPARVRLGGLSRDIRKLQQEWTDLQQREQLRQRQIDMLQYQIKEIQQANPSEQEESDLTGRKALFQNRERIHMHCESLLTNILDKDDSLLAQLRHVLKDLEDLKQYDETIAESGSRLSSVEEDLVDLTRKVDDLRRSLDYEEGSLDQIEVRLDELHRLKRKYGPTIKDVLTHLETSGAELERLLHAGERAEEIVFELKKMARQYEQLASEMTEARRAGKQRFETCVETELKNVAMEKCRFRIDMTAAGQPVASAGESDWMNAEFPPQGRETIAFEIEPNPGEGFRPLEKIASGGELSRLMLGLKVVMQTGGEGTLIFDEVDAGIGGRIAHRVGDRLKQLSTQSQVLCVTHLPQVAAFGDSHFQVSKDVRDNRTTTIVERLSEQGRIRELARMLSGDRVTDTALQHARELVEQGSSARPAGTE